MIIIKVKVLVTQSCPTLCDPMGCSLPGSSVHGTLEAAQGEPRDRVATREESGVLGFPSSPWTEEPGGIQPVRSQRAGHD